MHVLEGRHVFAQLTVEDNLRSGGFVRRLSRQDMAQDLERIYAWFPRLKTKRKTRPGSPPAASSRWSPSAGP